MLYAEIGVMLWLLPTTVNGVGLFSMEITGTGTGGERLKRARAAERTGDSCSTSSSSKLIAVTFLISVVGSIVLRFSYKIAPNESMNVPTFARLRFYDSRSLPNVLLVAEIVSTTESTVSCTMLTRNDYF
jgi:hypothetical protein